jgi:hypothetical protein
MWILENSWGPEMSAERGTGGKNANYGWSPREEPPDDPAVSAWLAALWAKPFTYFLFLEATPLQWQWRKESPDTLKDRNICC